MTNRTHGTRTVGALTPRHGLTSHPGQQPVISRPRERPLALPAPVIWGAVWGVIQAVSPLGFWWLEPKTVYALGLPLIAAVYIGFSVADGRWHVIAAETIVAGSFVVIAAMSVSGSAWLLVAGLAGHGLTPIFATGSHPPTEWVSLMVWMIMHGYIQVFCAAAWAASDAFGGR